jgi:hypothetical protein
MDSRTAERGPSLRDSRVSDEGGATGLRRLRFGELSRSGLALIRRRHWHVQEGGGEPRHPAGRAGSLQANPGSGSAAKRHVHHVFRTFAEEVMFYEANRARRAPVHRTTGSSKAGQPASGAVSGDPSSETVPRLRRQPCGEAGMRAKKERSLRDRVKPVTVNGLTHLALIFALCGRALRETRERNSA